MWYNYCYFYSKSKSCSLVTVIKISIQSNKFRIQREKMHIYSFKLRIVTGRNLVKMYLCAPLSCSTATASFDFVYNHIICVRRAKNAISKLEICDFFLQIPFFAKTLKSRPFGFNPGSPPYHDSMEIFHTIKIQRLCHGSPRMVSLVWYLTYYKPAYT